MRRSRKTEYSNRIISEIVINILVSTIVTLFILYTGGFI
jgi:hypothetical protein